MTSKAAQHNKLSENSVQEWVQDKMLTVCHIPENVYPADIFTKEMRDGAHFCHLHNSFMSCLSDFLSDSILAIHHATQRSPNMISPAASCGCTSGGLSGYFIAPSSSSFF
jgi:hypothetical protein